MEGLTMSKKKFIAVVAVGAWTIFVGITAFDKGMDVGEADRIEARQQLSQARTLLMQRGQQQAQACEALRKDEEERQRLSDDYKRRQFNERNGIIQAYPNRNR
jgi:hypothetical protein